MQLCYRYKNIVHYAGYYCIMLVYLCIFINFNIKQFYFKNNFFKIFLKL